MFRDSHYIKNILSIFYSVLNNKIYFIALDDVEVDVCIYIYILTMIQYYIISRIKIPNISVLHSISE